MSATTPTAAAEENVVGVDPLAGADATAKDEKKESVAKESDETNKPGAPTEFDPIIPELAVDGTMLLAEGAVQLAGKTSTGVECKVFPLRTRELLAVGRVLTGSTRPLDLNALLSPIFTAGSDAEQEAATIAAFTSVIITVPHSEREFVELLNRIVDPVDEAIIGDEAGMTAFYNYLRNPEIVDTVKIVAQVYKNEHRRARELGKVLMNMFPALKRTPGLS